jgi:hypothetical protein
MGEKITITSYNGQAINDTTNYTAYFLADSEPLSTFESSVVQAEVAGDFPNYVSAQPGGRVYPLKVVVTDRTLADIRQLKAWMTPLAGEVYLRGTDVDAVAWRLSVKCLQLVPWEGQDGVFVARLYAATPVWEQDSEQTDTQSAKSASPISYSVTAVGSVRTYPTFEITPTAVKNHANGYCRRWQVVTANKVPRTLMDTLGFGYPIDIANNLLDTDAEATAGRIQADLDDLRVFVDGKGIAGLVGVDRYLDPAGDDATTKVWCNIAFSPARTATIAAAMTDAAPANAGTITVDNAGGLAGWPESGFLLADDEVIYYASRTDTAFVNITRACRNTTAAAHSDAITVYWVEHDIQILYDYQSAANPPASTDTMPVISLSGSTNAAHVYPGPFVSSATARTGQFLPTYRETNDLAPYLSMQDTGSVLNFIDSPAEAGKPQANNIELYTPCGVDTAGSPLTLDVTVPSNMLFRAYGSDEEGNESLLAEWNPDTDGDAEVLTPAAVLTRMRYEAVVRTVTASIASGGTPANASIFGSTASYADYVGQEFKLAATTTIYSVIVRLKKSAGSPTGSPDLSIRNAASGGAGWDDAKVSETVAISLAGITTSFADYLIALTNPITLPAGTYTLTIHGGMTAGNLYWDQTNYRRYSPASSWEYPEGGATGYIEQPDISRYFYILGDGSVTQDEVPTNTDAVVITDDHTYVWDTPPYVKAQASEAVYAFNATLGNTTTGQTLTIHGITAANYPVTIDCANKRVTAGSLALSLPYWVEASDEREWLYLESGSNALVYTEADIGQLNIVTNWRGRWS